MKVNRDDDGVLWRKEINFNKFCWFFLNLQNTQRILKIQMSNPMKNYQILNIFQNYLVKVSTMDMDLDYNPNLLEKEQKFVVFYYCVTTFLVISFNKFKNIPKNLNNFKILGTHPSRVPFTSRNKTRQQQRLSHSQSHQIFPLSAHLLQSRWYLRVH